MTDDKRPLNGPAVIQAVMSCGPIQIGDLIVTLQASGYDTGTVNLTKILGALRASGRLILHEGYWAYSVISILRLDDRQLSTMQLLYEEISLLASSVNELVRVTTKPPPFGTGPIAEYMDKMAKAAGEHTAKRNVDLINDAFVDDFESCMEDKWRCPVCCDWWVDGCASLHDRDCEGDPEFIPKANNG